MRKLLSIIPILCLFICIGQAQESNNALLTKFVEKKILTQVEANELRHEIKKEDGSKKIRNIFNSPLIQIGGNGQLMHRYSDIDKIHHDTKAKNLFVSINGKLNEVFRYGFLLEFVNPSVQEFWGEWTLTKEFNLRAGQFKSSFTIESQYVPATLETAAYSRTISNLVGYAGEDDVLRKQNGKNNFGRDAGIMASGELIPISDHRLLQYSLGLFQGTGVTTGETNGNKDFVGMLLLQPIKGFRIGGGVYFGEATYIRSGQTEASNHVRNRWYLSSDYKSERFNARAEWIKANDGGIDKEGVYALASYFILPKKLNILAKTDYYNRDKNFNTEVVDYTVGINYYFYNQCRVQLNYTHSDYSEKWNPNNSNAIITQLQIGL